MDERFALEDLYSMTDGGFWYQSWNWCSDFTHGKWHGLELDEAGHVAKINLRENFLRGSLKDFHLIYYLKNLVVISIFSNFIEGPLPSEIGRLQQLQEINISWNKFSGKSVGR
jgi:hypothetical protein